MKKRDLCHESKRPEEPSFTVTNVPSIFEKKKERERNRHRNKTEQREKKKTIKFQREIGKERSRIRVRERESKDQVVLSVGEVKSMKHRSVNKNIASNLSRNDKSDNADNSF